MANHEINEEQEAVNKALRMIETSDPVHADVYNALFSILINNDVFLEKLANKMVQQVMISHVMDSTNPDMVMGADQGPVITKLIEKVQKQVDVLNTNLLSGVQCAVVNCSTNSPALYPWNTSDYINSINWLVILSSDSNSYSVYSISGNKKIICAEEYPGESNTPKLYLSDGKIYVSLKNHELKYDVLIVRFGKYIPKNG